MHTSIELDEALYRRLQREAVRRGRSVAELVEEGVRNVLSLQEKEETIEIVAGGDAPVWFGLLRSYAMEAAGRHNLSDMRRSIVLGREGEPE